MIFTAGWITLRSAARFARPKQCLVMPSSLDKGAKRVVHGFGIFEYCRNLRIENYDIGSCLVALEVLAPYSFGKVIFLLHVIGPRIAFAPLGWQAAH